MDAFVWQSIITLALLHKFVYKFRENNTCIILDRAALFVVHGKHWIRNNYVQNIYIYFLLMNTRTSTVQAVSTVQGKITQNR